MSFLDDIVSAVGADHSPQAIAAALSRMVSSGELPPGSRLPTVRSLAAALGTSLTTVSSAWQALLSQGVIEARGRRGSYVRAQPTLTRRYTRMSGDRPANFRLDLATGTPDPALLPDLAPALRRTVRRAHVSNYQDEHVLPALADRLRESWPGPLPALTVVDGALDALDRLVDELVPFGGRVLVENPTFPALLDMLDQRGAHAIPVHVDAQGPVPQSVAAGLASGPVAFFLQPRAQNPVGSGLTRARLRALGALLRGTEVVVVEDDHSGDVAPTADLSLATLLPEQVVHVRSYSKSHGPDLRIAAVGGPVDLIDRLHRRRQLGPGWSSRLLQGLLVELLDDPRAEAAVAHAREVYEARRAGLRAALAERGVDSSPGGGVNLWIAVDDEAAALVTLAAAGVRVSPGSAFLAAPLASDHIRVTSGVLTGGLDQVADDIATAAVASLGLGAGGSVRRASRAHSHSSR